IVYSEILDDEQGHTAADFWERAAAWFGSIGIQCERVITDNGGCYRSGLWHRACKRGTTGIRPKPAIRCHFRGVAVSAGFSVVSSSRWVLMVVVGGVRSRT
ncbi:MAG: transposase family protein, partial [bacterium]|nr:transposase family protein [bacterium]